MGAGQRPPREEGHRPYRLSWDKKVVVTGFCHSRVPSKGGTEVHCHSGDSFLSVNCLGLSDAAAGLLYLHQDTCSARLRLYSNTPTASLLHLKHRITLVASCHIGLECHDEDWGLKFSLRPISMVICCNCCVRIYAVRHTATDNRRMISTSQS